MTQTVKLGTYVDNIGIEGISNDPQTAGYICVKEKDPEGIFQTGIDFVAGTATNGSPTTVNSVNLFNPALANVLDLADVFALSNLPALAGQANSGNLLLLSQESVKIEHIDRTGTVSSSLTIVNDPGNPLSVAEHQHEGIAMDNDGFLYTVCENGGGDTDHPQLWIYAPSTFLYANQAPLSVSMAATTTSLPENTSTATNIKLGYVDISDDGMGVNAISLSGADAGNFEIINNNLYLKAGTMLDFETKGTYTVTVNVDDPTIGSTPDASTVFTLHITDIVEVANIIISEVTPWGSGNSPVAADWFEVTNTGNTAANITGWKMDDNSNSFGASVALNGITSIAPGESVIFIETANLATVATTFRNNWFGANPPAGLQIGNYTGSGVGLSTGGDAVNLYNAAGVLQANVSFGASTTSAPYRSFDNAAGINNAAISQLSAAGVNGAFIAVNSPNEIGSPGKISCPVVTLTISGSLTFCAGSSTILDAGAGYSAYLWSTGALTQTITVNSAGTYTVTVTTNAGCQGTASVNTMVNPSLPVSVSVVPSANPFNAGMSVTFTATPVNGGTSPAYQWKVNGSVVSGTNTATYTYIPQNNDVVSCILTSNALCATGNPATSNQVTMIVSLIPSFTNVSGVITNGQNECYNALQTITVAGINGSFHVHNGGSANMIAGVNILYEPGTLVEAGGYMHGYIAPGGPWCGAKSANVLTTVATGEVTFPAAENNSTFIVYPNPTSGQFIIEQRGDAAYRNIQVDIYGMQGNKVYSSQNNGSHKMDCNLEGNSSGLYHIRINADGNISIFKLILTR